jgi:hypothetical protein
MNSIHISITCEDIEAARSYELPPLLFVLVRTTGTLWRVSHCGVAFELITPHRSFVLPTDALQWWQFYCLTGRTEPHEFTVAYEEVKATSSLSIVS